MVIAILANDNQKKELLSAGFSSEVEPIWADSLRALGIIEADAYFDLEFSLDPERIARLKKLLPRPVLVNSVVYTLSDLAAPFIRINGWPGCLQAPFEVAGSDERQVSDFFSRLGVDYRLVPDQAGMISGRLFGSLINQAWKMTDAGISQQDADLAFRRCSAAHIGLAETTDIIGREQLLMLLTELSRSDNDFLPADALNPQGGSTTPFQWH